MHRVLLLAAALLPASVLAQSQQTTPPPPKTHHLDASGKSVMGFDQQSTAHHFLLFTDGGAIDVSVKDAKDQANLTAIRSHLPHITMLFGQGNFDAPMLVHDTKDVPGTKDLVRLKDKIH